MYLPYYLHLESAPSIQVRRQQPEPGLESNLSFSPLHQLRSLLVVFLLFHSRQIGVPPSFKKSRVPIAGRQRIDPFGHQSFGTSSWEGFHVYPGEISIRLGIGPAVGFFLFCFLPLRRLLHLNPSQMGSFPFALGAWQGVSSSQQWRWIFLRIFCSGSQFMAPCDYAEWTSTGTGRRALSAKERQRTRQGIQYSCH